MVHAIPACCAVGGVFAASGAFAWGAVGPSAQLFGPTIRRTGAASAMALTFDDGPNPAITPLLLDLLDRHQVKATFFLVGTWVREESSLAHEIVARGHALGNHTDTHPSLALLSSQRITQELDRCDDAIESATARKPRWMRPPFGFRSPFLDGVLRRRGGAGVVMWSAWARDWKPQPAEPVIERLRRARGGDIVLLHDGDHRVINSDRRHTVAALEYWLPRWKESAIRFVTLDEMQPQRQSGKFY
ncbi:MAG TPA: polysaccharide deacetylase family protein [Candidatus Acidoferrales bacterium]|jgi:peptidoglycan/xylan/chitin deacetylase (PgdA/CDA1 family)|nr:polysaccharide deacetylase family protein [Candidatus Acidoferrales bacterium]